MLNLSASQLAVLLMCLLLSCFLWLSIPELYLLELLSCLLLIPPQLCVFRLVVTSGMLCLFSMRWRCIHQAFQL